MLTKEDFLYDKRLTERFLADGHLSRKQHDAFLASLPNVEDKAEPLLAPEQDEDAVSESAESAETHEG